MLETFFVLVWGIWQRRNKNIFERVLISPKGAMEQALYFQEFFTECSTVPKGYEEGVSCWQSPLEGWFKLNVDEALFFDSQEAGVGAIIRDYKGNVTTTASIREQNIQQPEIIESLAIYRGLQLYLQLGIPKIIIESDCQVVLAELQRLETYLSILGNLFQDIKALMSRFQNSSIQFRFRKCNVTSHKLAKFA